MNALIFIIYYVLTLYMWAVIISAVLSWLVAFNVINRTNQFVNQVGAFLYQLTEPALRPIRRVIPVISGVDLSPLVLILGLVFVRRLLIYDIAPALLG